MPSSPPQTIISFPVQTAYGPIRGEAASAKELESFVPVLVREFGRYPKAFVKKMTVHRIVLCRKLVYIEQDRGQPPPDLPTGWQIQKEKTAGNVRFMLVSPASDGRSR